MKISR